MAIDPSQPPRCSESSNQGHETRDAKAKWIFGLVTIMFVLGLAIQGILAGFLNSLKQRSPPTDSWRPVARTARAESTNPPLPRLQVSPPRDLQAFQKRQEQELNTYGWINRTARVVRLPIERAMELVLQESLPVRSGTNAASTGPSPYQLLQQRAERREAEIKTEP
jgi:hypothetical protein